MYSSCPRIPTPACVWPRATPGVGSGSGLSLALLRIFCLLVDVCGLGAAFFFFTVIGTNPITIYFLEGCLVGFVEPVEFVFGGAIVAASAVYQGLLRATAVVGTEWLLLLFLYRKQVCPRV